MRQVRPPSYLTPEQKKQFRKIAKELLEIKLISNLDCDALARLLMHKRSTSKSQSKSEQLH